MNRDNNCYDCFNEVADEALLACHYDALPAYIAPLKAVLTAGHYILVSINSGNRFVAEILHVYQSQLSVCCTSHYMQMKQSLIFTTLHYFHYQSATHLSKVLLSW
jgi:hypothetical protein